MILRHSKIVCTIGPASRSPRMIRKLIEAGMDVARLNFSHGTHQEHAQSFAMLREASVKFLSDADIGWRGKYARAVRWRRWRT